MPHGIDLDMDVSESDSDFELYSDTSDSDDHDGSESMYDGRAECLLSNLDQSISRIDGYLSFERQFSYGDLVKFATEPFGQMGQVVSMEMVVDLEGSSGEILREINSKKLVRVRSFAEGDCVVHGAWLGRVVKVYDLVKVLLDDGTEHIISTADTKSLAPCSAKFLDEGSYMYIPGQRIKVNCSSGFGSWLCGIWSDGYQEGNVCSVEPGPVLVSWITPIYIGFDTSPPRLQEAKNLVLLSCFPHVNWQLGDWCRLSPFISLNPDMASNDQIHLGTGLRGPSQMESMNLNIDSTDDLYSISRTKTHLDVLWQDGSLSVGLDSQSLSPVSTVGDHDFLPSQFVLVKAPTDYSQAHNARCLGIVKGMDAKENIVTVKWVAQEPLPSKNYPRFISEDNHSVYELMEHPDFSYCFGDVVIRLPKNNCSVDANLENVCYAADYLSSIGNIVGRKDGYFEVRWASGIISKVEPSEICGMDKIEIPPMNTTYHRELAEDILIRDNEALQKNKEELSGMEANRNGIIDLQPSGSCLFPRTAINFFTDIASSIFGLGGSSSQCDLEVADNSDVLDGSLPTGKWSPSFEMYSSHQCSEMLENETSHNKEDLLYDGGHLESLKPPKLMVGMLPKVDMSLFKQFDIVNDCSDHYFANGIGDISQVKNSWFKNVQEEWRILEADLPDSINVRVYEDRMDLLRASVVGAAGTPYHDAIFFFDICFPPDYPHEPPAVHYISNGLRLNPNLYESGKVCLSLLKTWAGSGSEVWDPKHSTLLQVLLSLQALVLNAKPYFNEAGYDKQIGRAEGERNSITYNENAFLLSRKSMLYQLHQPPKHFEALVDQHFRSRSLDILSTCKSFIEGTCNCYDLGLGEPAIEGERGTTTSGFKIMLAKLLPMLVTAFAEQGIDCSQFQGVAGLPV